MATNFRALVTAPGLTTDAVFQQYGVTPPAAPGNVGVCLSGGGSRAMSAGKGQLQALAQLGLLGKVRALSTVSGGSWCGVSYIYVNDPSISDATLLGTYTDPSQLTTASISSLSAQSIGSGATSWFSIPDLLLEAIKLSWEGVPSNELWQTLIGNHILEPLGLNASSSSNLPTGWFTYNDATENGITGPPLNNSGLPNPVYQVASGNGRIQRPYHICNFALLLDQPAEDMVPVQATPFFTGVMTQPQPNVQDANGNAPGGGGITSFAFNSLYAGAGSNGQVNATQTLPAQWQFTPVDAAGTSSAAFAATLSDYAREWLADPARAIAEISALLAKRPARKLGLLSKLPALMMLFGTRKLPTPVADVLNILLDIVPEYWYWPPATPTASVTSPDYFADGGSLENTGINGMLAYQDIETLLAFVNTSQPITASPCGVLDASGNTIPGTCFEIDDSIPPLFGYQPYQSGIGYQLYAGASNPSNPAFAHNQVFASSEFSAVIVALSNAAAGGQPTVFLQSLQVMSNPWFGIAGGNTVTVVWYYLNPVPAWTAQLTQDVRNALPSSFPNYNTFTMLELTPQQVNLLTNLAAWSVVQSASIIKPLFR